MRTEEEIRADAADEPPFSNGSEHDIWADRYCHNNCVNDDDEREIWCPIITVALLGKAGDGSSTAWPKEWTRASVPWTDRDGVEHAYERVDTCTEYEERRDPDDGEDLDPQPVHPPQCKSQIDIIDVYLPVFMDEITPRPAEADR